MLQELLSYNADIVCLQEVDEKAFTIYFQPQLQHAGAHEPLRFMLHIVNTQHL